MALHTSAAGFSRDAAHEALLRSMREEQADHWWFGGDHLYEVSVQPIYGGPVYVMRNAIYNVVMEPFKMHNGPSGALRAAQQQFVAKDFLFSGKNRLASYETAVWARLGLCFGRFGGGTRHS